MASLIIIPKTKIYDLLEAYPDLEDILISSAPEFKKLKNPVLRKTIARITSIGQAATVGGLDVQVLVNRLREKAGQGNIDQLDDTGHKYNTVRPAWFRKEAVVKTIDTNEMLNKGEHPVHVVLAAIKELGGNEILEIIASFIPAPLLDKTLSLEYKHWVDRKSDREFRIYFMK
jgi:hypothetical protein